MELVLERAMQVQVKDIRTSCVSFPSDMISIAFATTRPFPTSVINGIVNYGCIMLSDLNLIDHAWISCQSQV